MTRDTVQTDLSVQGAGHRTVKPAELTEPRGEEQAVTEEVVATEEVAVEDTSMDLDQDLDRLLRFACIHTHMQ